MQAGDGSVIYSVRGHLLGIPKKMSITDAAGTEVASLKSKKFSLVKDKMTMEMANGEPWQLTGQFIEKNYTVTSGGRDVVRISQKWVTHARTSTPSTSPTEPTRAWRSRSSGPSTAGSSGTDDEPSPGT